MENFIYYFLKFLSFIFLALGLTYLANNHFYEAALALISFGIIRYLDSRSFYDKFWDKKCESIQIILGFIFLCVNIFFYYQFFITRPYIINANEQQKEIYSKFEKNILKQVEECKNPYNNLIINLKNGSSFNNNNKKEVNSFCSPSMLAINTLAVDPTSQLPGVVNDRMNEIKQDYLDLISAIIRLNYSKEDEYDKTLSDIVKYNQEDAFKKMSETREMLRLPKPSDKSKQIFETLQ